MRQSAVTMMMAVLVVLGTAAGASAQTEPIEREGFVAGGGGGVGWMDFNCDGCLAEGREVSGVADARLGYAINEQLVLGGQFAFWGKTSPEAYFAGDFKSRISDVLATATFYPMPESGFFVRGGAGLTIVHGTIVRSANETHLDTRTGWGLTGGAGFDIPVSKHVAITPAVNMWYGHVGDLRIGTTPYATNVSHNTIDVTLGLTFFSGTK